MFLGESNRRTCCHCLVVAKRFERGDDLILFALPAGRRSCPGQSSEMDGPVSPVLHGSGFRACAGVVDGSDTRARQAHSEFGASHHRARGRFQLHLLSSGSEPRTLEQPCYSKPTSGVDHRPPRPGRTCGDRHRRHHRATLGAEDRCPRHLPRPGPIEPCPFRQDQRLALVELHGAVPGPLGKQGQGAAVPVDPCALGKKQPRPWQGPQTPHGLGPARHAPDLPMVADASPRLCR